MTLQQNKTRPVSRRLFPDWNNKSVFVCFPKRQVERLQETCFRKAGHYAGNFLHWREPGQFLSRAKALLEEVVFDELKKGLSGRVSFELDFGEAVGWSSTLEVQGLPPDLVVEERKLNGKAKAVFLLPENRVKAQLTERVTCVGEIKENDHAYNVVLYSVYPGRDVGELVGDVTAREGVVFLDWETRGETPPNTLPSGLYLPE